MVNNIAHTPRKVVGIINWAQYAPEAPLFKKGKKPTKVQRDGLLYEEKVHKYIEEEVKKKEDKDLHYLKSPWIVYREAGAPFNSLLYCQPDTVLVHLERKLITIVEIKLQHTEQAWWQIRKLYEPILRHIYPGFNIHALEVVKWMDGTVAFPESIVYSKDLFSTQDKHFCVHMFSRQSRSNGKGLLPK